MTDEIAFLASQWLQYKEAEREATEARRAIEDRLAELLDIKADKEGSATIKSAYYSIKVTCRIDRRVDAELVQVVAAENDLTASLPRLFRWKPELNMSAWNSAPGSVQSALSAAITSKPGRPSFSITAKQKEEK